MPVENFELWSHGRVECLRGLVGNLAFPDVIFYAPEQVFVDAEATNCA